MANTARQLRIQTKADHGRCKPTAMFIEEAADIWAFRHAVLQDRKEE